MTSRADNQPPPPPPPPPPSPPAPSTSASRNPSERAFAEPEAEFLLEIESLEARTGRTPCLVETQALPYEVLLRIFARLGIADRFAAASACASWRGVACDRDLWKTPLVERLMPTADDSRDPGKRFAEIFRHATMLQSARIKFSKEPASESTPIAVLQFGNLRHVVARVGIGAEVALVEALGELCPNVSVLSFQFMQFLDLMVVGYLHKFRNLASLSITDSFIEDNDQLMSVLGENAPNLEFLEVPYMRDQGLLQELGPSLGPKLKALYFSAHRMDGRAFRNPRKFSLAFPKLIALGISYPAHLPVRQMISSLKHFKKLVVLRLINCPNPALLADVLVADVFPHLRLLAVTSFQFGADFGSALDLPSLRHLALESENVWTAFGDAGLQRVARGAPNLEFLRLEYFRQLTSKSVDQMADGAMFPKLRSLFLATLMFVKTAAVQRFAKKRPEVEVVKEDNGLISFQNPPFSEDPKLYTKFFHESCVHPSWKRLTEMQKVYCEEQ